MKSIYKSIVTAVLVVIGSLPGSVLAESNSDVGASPSATARLDFQIVIPGILRFQVGTAGTNNVDLIEFQPAGSTLGDGTDTNATAASGNLGNGAVTVSVVSNAGQVTITETNNSSGAGLDNGAGDNIPYSEILTTSGDATNLPAPTLSDGSSNTSQPVISAGTRVTVRNSTWTYTYDNTDIYPEGTYGGVNTQGGRVTYTAATP
jgi:hypothetical protein